MEMPKTITVIRDCPRCSGITEVRMMEDHYIRWQQGDLIQIAAPEMPPAARETLITGYCEACWNALFPEEDQV